MPIYEYICKNCNRRFETFVSLGQKKTISCDKCGSKDVQKLFSSFGIGGGSSRLRSSSDSCQTCSTKTCTTCK
ncbi:MAG: zinc ribbon domain-containing protein [Candidatus Aminicenantes bacterium]|nr:zinc ribbon domain-containing protein [Candidatus Aminicenantes bacterium]